MNGIKRAALYAWGCNKTKELGVDEALAKFIFSPGLSDEDEIAGVVKKLYPNNSFMKLRVEIDDFGTKDYFSDEVAKTYWLGGAALRAFGKFLPFHNFEVLETGSIVKRNKKAFAEFFPKMLECCVFPATISSFPKNRHLLVVDYSPVEYGDGKFFLSLQKKRFVIKVGFLSNVKVGDFISFHLGHGREKISKKENDSLIFWTQQSMDILNKK